MVQALFVTEQLPIHLVYRRVLSITLSHTYIHMFVLHKYKYLFSHYMYINQYIIHLLFLVVGQFRQDF